MVERYQFRPMRVHPAYSIDDELWFTEYDVTAKTLAELQQKLPQATIEGYYPKGYTHERAKLQYPPEMQSSSRTPFRSSQQAWTPSTSRRKPPTLVKLPEPMFEDDKPTPVKEEETETKDLGTADFRVPEKVVTSPEVLQITKDGKRHRRRYRESAPVVRTKYNRGEPRAPRTKPFVNWAEKDATVRRLAAGGNSGGLIAEAIGTTRSAVAGYCHRKGIKLLG